MKYYGISLRQHLAGTSNYSCGPFKTEDEVEAAIRNSGFCLPSDLVIFLSINRDGSITAKTVALLTWEMEEK